MSAKFIALAAAAGFAALPAIGNSAGTGYAQATAPATTNTTKTKATTGTQMATASTSQTAAPASTTSTAANAKTTGTQMAAAGTTQTAAPASSASTTAKAKAATGTQMASASTTQTTTPAPASMTAPDAQMHFKAIANASLSDIMGQYAPGATLQWVGGPLNGTYTGNEEIREAWGKFIHAMGPTTEKTSDVNVATDAKGMTVTANVDFSGKASVPVRYVLVYRGKQIVDEVWQIAGKKAAM